MGEKKISETEVQTERGTWSNGIEFLLSCISISIGLGNVWRFPNLAYENGGGAFLIPYFVVIFLVSKPLYYMELAFGQFTSKSPVRTWSCVPGLKGIGMAQLVSTFFLTVFYNYIMAISIFYIFASMQSSLPWTTCDSEWADNGTCFTSGSFEMSCNVSDVECNSTLQNTSHLISAPEQYFNNYVIKDAGNLENISRFDWRMALCLLMTWSLVALSTVKGVQSLGKVVYLTASYPYVVLISMLILALTMDGSVEGIKYFFTPEWKRLLSVTVWYKACEQSFFSLNTGFGHLIMYASYNNFRHNIHRDAMIITVADTLTSVLAGCVVFAILGTLAFELNQPIQDVVKNSGLRLAFVAYPEALGRIQVVPQLWSVMFFIMLYMLGLGSAVGHIEAITTTIKDEFPSLHKNKAYMAVGACAICFVCGLPMATDAGQYIMPLLDGYGVGAAIFIYGILEIVGIMWIYGWRKFCDDVHFMLGCAVQVIWKVTWAYIAPVALIVIYIYGTVNMVMEGSSTPRGIPEWGMAIAWVLSAICIVQIPLWFVIVVYQAPEKSLKMKLLSALRPSSDWGPSDPETKAEWLIWKQRKLNPKAASHQSYDNKTFHV